MVAHDSQPRIVAFDLETTGLSSTRHRLIEVAAVCWEQGREVATFESLVDPGCFIPRRVIGIHGITDAMVAGKPAASVILPEFFAFCQADILVAHNAPFDMGFLNAECARAGMPPFAVPVVDSCALARQRFPSSPNFRLETLKAVLGLGRGQTHRALQDARDCLAIFLQCLRHDTPPLHLPLEPPPLEEPLVPLSDALRRGGTVTIEYRDSRGRVTNRAVRPIHIEQRTLVAFCLLRNDRRHFALDRIQRVLSC